MFILFLIFIQTLIVLLSNLERTAARKAFYSYEDSYDTNVTDTEMAFYNYDIITDGVLRLPPYSLLTVRYKDTEIYPGDMLSATKMIQAPKIEWDCDYRSNYTLAMCNPDTTLSTPGKPMLFWFVENIPNCDVNQGNERVKYLSPVLAPGKMQRFVYLLWELYDLPSQDALDYNIRLTRLGFSPDEVSNTYRVDPFAGNLLSAKTDVVSQVSGLTE